MFILDFKSRIYIVSENKLSNVTNQNQKLTKTKKRTTINHKLSCARRGDIINVTKSSELPRNQQPKPLTKGTRSEEEEDQEEPM